MKEQKENKFSENSALLERISLGDKTAEERIIRENMGLVKSIAARFSGRGQELEDLIQIGSIGMLKAVRGYDSKYNTAFSTYAVPMIIGEIKRFLRDDGLIKVSREAKRNHRMLMTAKEEYTSAYGREPRLAELCEMCGIETEDAVYAMEACAQTISLQDKIGGDGEMSVEDLVGDEVIGDVTERIALREAVEKLDKTEKTVIYMRYFKGMTQTETAKRLGATQVKISRMEKKIMGKLRGELSAKDDF